MTLASSLMLTCTYSGECCDVNDGTGVSAEAAAVVGGGGDGGDMSGTGVLSTSTYGA